MLAVKEKYAPLELAEVLKISRQAIEKRANKEAWPISSREDKSLGKFYSYETLPDDIKAAIARHLAAEEPRAAKMEGAIIPDWSHRIGLARYRLAMEWRAWRAKSGSKGRGKTGATVDFLTAYNGGRLFPELFATLGETQKSTLYRWETLLKEHGDDYQAVCDRRGGWTQGVSQGLGQLPPAGAEAFLAAWLTPNKPTVTLAYQVMAVALKKTETPLPSLATVYRYARRFSARNHDLYLLKREGEKALNDKALPYIKRDAERLEVGDCLFADGHTLNFECLHPETGRPFRPTLILWFDWKSRMPAGWEIMPSENTTTISAALRMAIINLGKIPRVAYLDNGRAFKSKFFTSPDSDIEALSGLYARLGVALQLAKPYHGQSKVVERFFGTFNEQFSRLAPSYTGRDIGDKPAWRLRNEKYHKGRHERLIPTLRQAMEAFRAYAAWYAERPHPTLREMSCGQVFEAGRGPGVDTAELDRLFLWSKKVKPQRAGFTLAGTRYESDSLYGFNQEIVIRFSWADLSEVHLYDLSGESLGKAYPQEALHPLADKLGDEHDKALVADRNRRIARLKKGTLRAARLLDGELDGLPGLAALDYAPEKQNSPEPPYTSMVPEPGSIVKPAAAAPEPGFHDLSEEERARRAAVFENAASDAGPRPELVRPPFFPDEFEKYDWMFNARMHGIKLAAEDLVFMAGYEASEEYRDITGARYEALKKAYGLDWSKGEC